MSDEPNTRCEKCGYEWEYSGGMAVATCPSCRYNTEARNLENDTETTEA